MLITDNGIITPELTGTILRGITRESVLTLSKSMNLSIDEQRITIDEVIDGIKSGTVKEIFGTGTAAVIALLDHYATKI
jgi:branched-chain amino acid aminotransferase